MSAYKHESSPVGQGPTLRSPRVTVARLLLRAVERWQRSRAVAALQGLNDRQLEDAGIARNDIPRVAMQLFPPKEGTSSRPSPAVFHSAAERVERQTESA